MKCPVDGETLVMTDRSGIEIDYCPSCRGVWLDRGELDKIIERAVPPAGRDPYERQEGGHTKRHVDPRDDQRHGGKPYGKRKGSLLGELFDF